MSSSTGVNQNREVTRLLQELIPALKALAGATFEVSAPQLPANLGAGGGIKIEGVVGGVAQPISAVALPLPAGAASETSAALIAARLGTSTRSDTFTTTSSGTTVNCTASPCKSFCIQITTTGVITLWGIVLETSLDGVSFSVALTHATADLTGTLKVTGATLVPALYWRMRCTAITLGAGTNVVAVGLGMP
jgi:hypothetical protein